METFIIYQLKAAICIALFTGLYYLLLRKETFHALNRFYLVSTLILSEILPAIKFPAVNAPTTAEISQFIGVVLVIPGNKAVNNGSALTAPEAAVSTVVIVYSIIALIFAIYLLYHIIRLFSLVSRRGTRKIGRYTIITMPEKSHSFTFFNLIFLSTTYNDNTDNNQVLQHELVHARQWHSADMLLVCLVRIVQWFNPFIYFIERALRETHEYLADNIVLERDDEPDRYRLLLLARVFGVQPGILSFFNYSLIKNRLTMMTKEKSPYNKRYKYLVVFPLIALMAFILSCAKESSSPVSDEIIGNKIITRDASKLNTIPVETIKSIEVTKDDKGQLFTVTLKEAESSDAYGAGAPPPPPPPDGEASFVFVEEPAMFQGGTLESFREWVQKNLVYPEEAVKSRIQGKVTFQFAVNSKGKVVDVKILRGVSPLLDQETYRVVTSSPDWTPARQGGKEVKQQFIMPVVFQLQ